MKESPSNIDRLAWYRDAKFGLFIHWGSYSVAGVEASWPIMVPEWAWLGGSRKISQKKYEGLAQRFNPEAFDADAWVQTALDSGMRYMIFTAKHHDGFCMFDAPLTDYKITNTIFGRDIVAELADACQRKGLRFGLYYSPPDMHHPGYRDTTVPTVKNWQGEPERDEWRTYLDYMEEHLRVLLTRYGHISIIWFDGLFDQEKYDPERFHRLIGELSPETLINDRLGGGGDYTTPEQGVPDGIPVKVKKGYEKPAMDPEFFAKLMRALKTPILRRIVRMKARKMSDEQRPLSPIPTEIYPDQENFLPWETCMTMNGTWGYCPTDRRWKSGSTLVRSLVEVASKGGNFLLSVGPKPDGTFPTEALDRLETVGSWVKANGEYLYGTTYGPVQGTDTIRTTERKGVMYAAIVGSEVGRIIKLEIAKNSKMKPAKATALATGSDLALKKDNGGGIEIDISDAVNASDVPVVLRIE